MDRISGFETLAYSIKEACSACRVGRTTLYKAISRGDLKIKKVGRRTVIVADELRSWLESCSGPVNADATDGVCDAR